MPTLLKNVSRNPVGIVLITDMHGKTIWEGEVRQCMHCQYTWKYEPGSGNLRGFCYNCGGHICGRKQCATCYHKEQRIEDMEVIAWGTKAQFEAIRRMQALREAKYQDFRDGRGVNRIR